MMRNLSIERTNESFLKFHEHFLFLYYALLPIVLLLHILIGGKKIYFVKPVFMFHASKISKAIHSSPGKFILRI